MFLFCMKCSFPKLVPLFENCVLPCKFLFKPFGISKIRMLSSISNQQIQKLDSPQFKSLFTAELNLLADIFNRNGYEIRIAGGAVRDLILQRVPDDVDFATTATPKEMVSMFEKEQIRMINNRGEKHGTITCRINDKENFEVTTLRFDVETDGRHAEVQFTTDWMLDAERRDLTINSMFLGLDGTLYDYFDGKKDLMDRKVRFVGRAQDRIKEDYLRILRYFRFYGRIASDSQSHEKDILNAIKENSAGLATHDILTGFRCLFPVSKTGACYRYEIEHVLSSKTVISGERLWVEIKKIMSGNYVDDIMRTMNELDVLEHLGFTGDFNFERLSHVWNQSKDLNPLPMTLISAMFYEQEQLLNLHARIKMSKDELQLGQFILEHRTDPVFLNNEIPQLEEISYASGESKEMKKLKLDSHASNSVTSDAVENTQNQVLFEGDLLTNKHEHKDDLAEKSKDLLNKCQDMLIEEHSNIGKTKIKILELLKYFNLRDTLQQFGEWNPPKFPVSGVKLIEIGVPRGPQFSRELSRLKEIWKQSRFTKTEEELLQCVKFKKKVGE